MKKLAKVKRKVNNAGMTLIEILVAMAILTIAIIPLMSGYLYSIKHNNKAKNMQQTSILANTMIENCKAYNVSTINSMVLGGSFMPNATDSISDTTNAPAGGYLYYFDDVTVSSGSNQMYDLSMKITPMGSESDMMSYRDMSQYHDAFFMEDVTPSTGTPSVTMQELQDEVYEYALEELQNYISIDSYYQTGTAVTVSLADIDASLKPGGRNAGLLEITRTITVNIDKTDDLETANIVCSYTFDTSGDIYYNVPGPDGTPVEYSAGCTGVVGALSGRTFDIYSNANDTTNAGLENLYLFFAPSYNNVGIEFDDDVICLNSNLESGRSVTLYLMKQKKFGMTDAEISIAETSYNPQIQLNSGEFVVYHNLTENLGSDVGLTGWVEPIYPGLEFKDSLIETDSKQLMYEVEVAIYDDGSYEDDGVTQGMTTQALSSMKGTFLNW